MATTVGDLWKTPTGSTKIALSGAIISGPGVTLADTNTVQTLTNKTLTAPTITNATFSNSIATMTVASLAGLGTNIATAAPIVSSAPALIFATGGNNSVGIQLPVALPGAKYTIKNDQAANGIMKVYPQVNSTINGLSSNTNIAMAANTCCDFIAVNATGWVTLPLLPS